MSESVRTREIQQTTDNGSGTTTLALRPKETARALGIGVRLLWTLTNRGEIPHVRLGRAVVYPVDALREYLANHCSKAGRK